MNIAGHDYQPGDIPSPELIRAARSKVGHSQSAAAHTVHFGQYQRWQEWEAGTYPMKPSIFGYYCLTTALVDLCDWIDAWRS